MMRATGFAVLVKDERAGNDFSKAEAAERIGVGADPAIKVNVQPGKCGGDFAAILRRIDGDVDEADRFSGIRRCDLLEAGQFFLAWAAPGGPEVHHYNLAVERGELARLSIECFESRIGGMPGQKRS